MAHFSEDELDSVSTANAPISFGFFCLCAGVFGSFLGVLLSSEIKDPTKHATCFMLTVSSAILALYFLWKHWQESKETRRKRENLRKRFGSMPQASK